MSRSSPMRVALVASCVAVAGGSTAEEPPTLATGQWLGARPRLAERGLTIEGYYTLDSSFIWVDGLAPGNSAARSLLDVGARLDLDRAIGWTGAEVFIGGQAFGGGRGDRITRDVQTFDNIDADPFVGLVEAWFQQTALAGRLRFKLGRMEANAEFATTETHPIPLRVRARRVFLHSSMGFSPTILRFGSYPRQALGLLVEGRPLPWLRVITGVFDAVLRPSPLSTLDAEPDEVPFASALPIGEVDVGWSLSRRELVGRLALGAWGIVGDPFGDTAGHYALAYQNLWQEPGSPGQGIAAFAQYGWADAQRSDVLVHLGGGMVWTGAAKNRDDDAVGVGASWVDLANSRLPPSAAEGELALEVFYRLQVIDFVIVQPDLQILLNPGGIYPNAVAGTMRLGIDL